MGKVPNICTRSQYEMLKTTPKPNEQEQEQQQQQPLDLSTLFPQYQESAYCASEPTGEDREEFMRLMKRRRVCMMHFLGPETGNLGL